MLAVVSDTSPLIYLSKLGVFSLLHLLHDRLFVPPAVWEEITVGGRGLPEANLVQKGAEEGWLQVRAAIFDPGALPNSTRLGKGEFEAILLARELAALLLTDDLEAREVAEQAGVHVTGTLGILIRARKEGHLRDLKSVLDRLRNETNFRINEVLYLKVLKAAGEHLSGS